MLTTVRRTMIAISAVLAMALLASAASAAITPTLTLDQTAGTTAASTTKLGLDITLAPTGGDTIKDLSLQLPPGLLPNAMVDGGACLGSPTPSSACQVGTGTVTAIATQFDVRASLPVAFDLVAPPKQGDLAGLALLVLHQQLGTPADVTVRPSGDPAGVGLDIDFTDIPADFVLFRLLHIPISVTELQSVFDGLRFPSRCPATPADVVAGADSYGDPTVKTATAPLQVTGCSGLTFAPAFTLSATRDGGDSGAQISTDLTQTAAQASTGSLTLRFPSEVLAPNVAAVVRGNLLCAAPASGTCTAVGSARADSPLYPFALTGQDYLTGSLAAPELTVVFPPPFPITLNGQVDLASNSTTFTGMPDIPLSDLSVTLAGGPDSLFAASCNPASGTAGATLTSQNGDLTASPTAAFTVANCPATPPAEPTVTSRRPRLTMASISGLAGGSPTLGFRLQAGRDASGLVWFAVRIPSGLAFVSRPSHGRRKVTGVTVTAAAVRSVSLAHGQLVVTLRKAAAGLTVKVRPTALHEGAALRSRARRHALKGLRLTVVARDAAHHTSTLTLALTAHQAA